MKYFTRASLLVFASFSLLSIATTTLAASNTSKNSTYIKLNLPTSFHFPVYIFETKQGGAGTSKQIAYYGDKAQSVFLGAVDTQKDVTYTLYQETPNVGWQSCTVKLDQAGKIDPNSPNACSGAVLANPTLSNEANLSLGADLSEMKTVDKPEGIQTPSLERTITFINNTNYNAIRIGEQCTVAKNPNNPNCKNTQNLTELAKGQSYTMTIGKAGLISYAFTMTAYKTAHGDWIETGGYDGTGKGRTFATKFEGTNNALSADSYPDTNIDASLVDGFNVGFELYPNQPTYATYTCINADAQCVGLYSKSTPMSELLPTNQVTIADLADQVSGAQHGSGDVMQLKQVDTNGNVLGAYSACTGAHELGDSQAINHYCCPTDTGGSAACRANGYASSAKYVESVHQFSKRTYAYSYDDTIGDYGMNGYASFTIEFK